MPRKNFNELRAKMDPKILARSDAKAKLLLAEIAREELRKHTGHDSSTKPKPRSI